MSQFLLLIRKSSCVGIAAMAWTADKCFEFSDDDYSSLLICHILAKEIGGPNDSLSQYIYDAEKKQKIDKCHLIVDIKTLKSESTRLCRSLHLNQNVWVSHCLISVK